MIDPKNEYTTYKIKQGRCFYTLSLDGKKLFSTHLWPYAVHYVNDVRNNIPTTDNAVSTLQKYTRTSVQTKVTTFYTFGCPIYALDSVLARCKKLPKWDARCVLGL